MHSRYRRSLHSDGETVHTGRVTRRTLLVATAALLAGADAAQARRLTPQQARALPAAGRGRVVTPATSGYDAARVVFNRRYDHVKPPAVVQVTDTDDVRAVVKWADRYDIPLVARSGGHGYNGDSTSNTAVVVDLEHLHRITYASGRATLGPSARTLDIYRALAAKGQTIPAGSCPTGGGGGPAPGRAAGGAGPRRADGPRPARVRAHAGPRHEFRCRHRGRKASARRGRRRVVLGAERRWRVARADHREAAHHPQGR